MWCRNCNIELNDKKCPVCGGDTAEDIPVEIFWCKACRVPVLQEVSQVGKGTCPRCGGKMKYMASDIRPVFPEERLLLEILLDRKPNEYKDKSVWALNSRYYIDGKALSLPSSLFRTADADNIAKKIEENKDGNDYTAFNETIKRFVEANAARLNYLKDEAYRFVNHEASKFPEENIVISFSGGKDSTATADVVIKSLSNPSLVHIFGDTTLEFQSTVDYAERYRRDHPKAIFRIARNNEQEFMEVCKDIGPPARMMRWCCSMFKTGPITRVINSLYRNQQILTFYGIRKSESVSRSKYNRVEDDAESVKIQQQTVASPKVNQTDYNISDIGGRIMTTSEMVKKLCKERNVTFAELARRIGQSRQNLYKKLKRDTLTVDELNQIADTLGVVFEQSFILPNGDCIKIGNKE